MTSARGRVASDQSGATHAGGVGLVRRGAAACQAPAAARCLWPTRNRASRQPRRRSASVRPQRRPAYRRFPAAAAASSGSSVKRFGRSVRSEMACDKAVRAACAAFKPSASVSPAAVCKARRSRISCQFGAQRFGLGLQGRGHIGQHHPRAHRSQGSRRMQQQQRCRVGLHPRSAHPASCGHPVALGLELQGQGRLAQASLPQAFAQGCKPVFIGRMVRVRLATRSRAPVASCRAATAVCRSAAAARGLFGHALRLRGAAPAPAAAQGQPCGSCDDQAFAGHLGRLWQVHQRQKRGRQIGQPPVAAAARPSGPPTRITGTGLVVCAVCGPPVTGSIMVSQLP